MKVVLEESAKEASRVSSEAPFYLNFGLSREMSIGVFHVSRIVSENVTGQTSRENYYRRFGARDQLSYCNLSWPSMRQCIL